VPSSSGIVLSGLTPTTDYYNSATNRLLLTNGYFSYDSNGNQTLVSPYAITYDAENRQTNIAINGSTTATYAYDGDGRRVTKTFGPTTTYVYDAQGDLAAEYSTQPPVMPCLTCYLSVDHLGSTRLLTDQNGNIVSRHDFLPFGEELTTSNRTSALGYGVTDNVMHKYTSKERDTETGFDFFHARYFSGVLGRFTGPDTSSRPQPTPYALRTDPQTLNLYSYLRNNPLARIDADGHGDSSVEITAWLTSNMVVSGPKQFFQDIALGVAKGVGSFAYDTVKAVVAASQGPAGVAAMLAPGPKALQPANKTQAQVSAATQFTLAVASVVAPAALEGAAVSTTSLFRAVLPAEAESIGAAGAWSNPFGIEVKYFSTSLEGAQSYASQATAAYGDGPFSLYGTEMPTAAITPEMQVTVDRGISTVAVPTGDLPKLTPPQAAPPE
jgi:RHS repeat-associated protein